MTPLRASPPLPTPRGEPRFGVDRGSIASDKVKVN
jgi:hypothetical protein